jgi:hypothetical protein
VREIKIFNINLRTEVQRDLFQAELVMKSLC